jgi:hypothetical protein
VEILCLDVDRRDVDIGAAPLYFGVDDYGNIPMEVVVVVVGQHARLDDVGDIAVLGSRWGGSGICAIHGKLSLIEAAGG